jgi:hypothetical protein
MQRPDSHASYRCLTQSRGPERSGREGPELSALLGDRYIQCSAWTCGFQRCGQPGQQHGLRIPPRILSRPTSMRRFLVSSLLADVTQQIHSFRASGVMAVQRPLAAASDSMARRKSGGSLWIVPSAIALVVMHRVSCHPTPELTGGRVVAVPVERIVRPPEDRHRAASDQSAKSTGWSGLRFTEREKISGRE